MRFVFAAIQLLGLVAALTTVAGVSVTVDPTTPLTNAWSAGEWDTDGSYGSWSTAQLTNATVAGGLLTASVSGADAQLALLNFPGGPDLDLGFNDFLDVRLQLPADYLGDVQIRYGVTNTPGISETRLLTIASSQIPKDGAFHVYRFDLGLEVYWRGNLRDLRIDPLDASGAGRTFALDYIRVGDVAGDSYLPRYTAANPAAGQLHELSRPVLDLASKHFRFQWDTNVVKQTGWTANMPHGTLRNLEEVWQLYVKHLGYREPHQSWTPANRDGKKYKVNVSTWHSGYWAGGDAGDYGRLNITPDGLRVDPPGWVVPHEFMHVCQMHQRDGAPTVDGAWWEGHANYGRELWVYHYRNLFPNQSGIDAGYLQSAHMVVAHGRDYYLSWPFFVYLDENPDALPDLGFGFMARLWQSNAPGVFPYTTIEQLTPASSLKDITGYFARRELTFDYSNQAAITNSLNSQSPTVWRRFQVTELLRRPDAPDWWRVPLEIAPMQGAYATHELVSQGSGGGRVVTVNFHGLPDAARGADWRAAFIVVSDGGAERYTPLWNTGSNSVTLAANENRLYLTVAGTPDQFVATGHDDLQYPYRSHPSKQRLHYELQVFGAAPKESDNGSTSGLIQHANGGGWKASTATVDASAYLGPKARVLNTAKVRNSARIEDYAVVRGNAQVLNNAVVSGHALIWENAVVRDFAKVRDWAIVSGSAVIADNARVLEHAQVQGGVVTNFATAKGCAIQWSSGTAGNYGVIDGDFMAARAVTNGYAFGHLPYTGVPDNWVRTAPDRFYAGYEFGAANDAMARDLLGVTDAYLVGGPVWRNNDAGRPGTLAFTGTNQYVVLDKSLCDLRQWSVALWMKWAGGSPGQPAVFFGSSADRCMFLTPDDGSGKITFSFRGNLQFDLVSTNPAPIGVWTHVAVTISTAAARLYVNGGLADEELMGPTLALPDSVLSGNTNAAPQHHYLARGADPTAPFFHGSLDSVRVYSKGLSDAEVAALATVPGPTAGTLYVDLRATHPSAGGTAWTNLGTLGNFTRVGLASLVANVAGTGIPGVQFSGAQAYQGPNSVADLHGSSDRSIEVWAYNPALVAEETMVSWGHRGTTRANLGFNFGNSTGWGAATAFNDDVNWGSTIPSANAWHHLVFTYSNLTAKVYVDGVLANSKTLGGVLATFANEPINLGCQRDTANGTRSFYFSGYLNTVRIHGGVLTDDQVAANYALGPAVNQAPELVAVVDQVIGAGVTISVTNVAMDADLPPQVLTFSLLSAPTGAGINATNGVVTWRPTVAQANTTHPFTVKVVDNGQPALSATQVFAVTVSPLRRPSLSTAAMAGGELVLQVEGDSGPDYTIQASTNLADWTVMFATNSPALPLNWSDPSAQVLPRRFYRVQLGP